MPQRLAFHRSVGSYLLTAAFLIVAIATGCTRDPFDRERPEKRFEDRFSYQTVVPSGTILNVAANASDDGRMAIAVATGISEITVYEETAGAWPEVASVSGGSVNYVAMDLAAGPVGTWWMLASDEITGMKLYRIDGSLDSTITIPGVQGAPWDTLEGGIAIDASGQPVVMLKAMGTTALTQGIFQAARKDTGWAFTQISGTTTSSRIWEFAIDPLGNEHLVYQETSIGAGQYHQVGIDSTHTSEVSGAGEFLAMSYDPEGIPYVGGSVLGATSLRLWHWNPTAPEAQWPSEQLPNEDREPYRGNFGLGIADDETPHYCYGQFVGSERFDLIWATRSPQVFGINWELRPIVRDVPRTAFSFRMSQFRLLIDGFDRPVFIFLSGTVDGLDSALVVAKPLG
jgi:hypothetical protein